MRILIDGDGCPVIKEAIRIAKPKNIEIIVFVDTSHIIKDTYPKVITVSKGADSADFKLVNYAQKKDIVITGDYGLATMALVQGCYVVNEDGREYNDTNIDLLLSTRHDFKKALKSGKRIPTKSKRTPDQDEMFIEKLDQIISTYK